MPSSAWSPAGVNEEERKGTATYQRRREKCRFAGGWESNKFGFETEKKGGVWGGTEQYHGGEVHGDALGVVVELPRGGDGLDLRVELHALLAVEVLRAAERAARAREGEHGEGHGDGEVDADLASVDLVLELAGSRACVRGRPA